MTKLPKNLIWKKELPSLGGAIIKFCQKIPRGPVTDPLITQLVKCGTSAGANYCEADDTESRMDFKHKIGG